MAKNEKARIEAKDKKIAQYADDNNMDIETLEEAIKSCQEGDDRQKLEDFISTLENEKREIENEARDTLSIINAIKKMFDFLIDQF